MFARVRLELNSADAACAVKYAPSVSEFDRRHYAAAVQLGVEYGYYRLPFDTRPRGLDVTVIELTTLAADTTPMHVAYAAAVATCQALGIRPEPTIQSDPDVRGFYFPA